MHSFLQPDNARSGLPKAQDLLNRIMLRKDSNKPAIGAAWNVDTETGKKIYRKAAVSSGFWLRGEHREEQSQQYETNDQHG